jgi:hypothetical protein
MRKISRKQLRKNALLSLLDGELQKVHHNAVMPRVKEWSYLPSDIMDHVHEYLSYINHSEIDDINRLHEEYDYHFHSPSSRGSVYQYGRSGATLAPESWIKSYGQRFIVRSSEDFGLSYGRIFALYDDIRRWNAWLKKYNSSDNYEAMLSELIVELLKKKDQEAREYAVNLLI